MRCQRQLESTTDDRAVKRCDKRDAPVLNDLERSMPEPRMRHGLKRAALAVLLEIESRAEMIAFREQDRGPYPVGWIAEECADPLDELLVERVALLGSDEPEHGDGVIDLDVEQLSGHIGTLATQI